MIFIGVEDQLNSPGVGVALDSSVNDCELWCILSSSILNFIDCAVKYAIMNTVLCLNTKNAKL